jgi:hypothetical protein
MVESERIHNLPDIPEGLEDPLSPNLISKENSLTLAAKTGGAFSRRKTI